MNLEISSQFRLFELGPSPVRPNAFRMMYSKYIYLTLVNNLNHLSAPHTLFKRGYSRTDELESLVESLELTDDGLTAICSTEDIIRKQLNSIISNDGYDFYGIYEISEVITSRGKTYLLRLVNDHRVLEWEAGRGKPNPEPELSLIEKLAVDPNAAEEECDANTYILKLVNAEELEEEEACEGFFSPQVIRNALPPTNHNHMNRQYPAAPSVSLGMGSMFETKEEEEPEERSSQLHFDGEIYFEHEGINYPLSGALLRGGVESKLKCLRSYTGSLLPYLNELLSKDLSPVTWVMYLRHKDNADNATCPRITLRSIKMDCGAYTITTHIA